MKTTILLVFIMKNSCNINTEIEMLFEEDKIHAGNPPLDNQLKQCFPNHGYFAFSALERQGGKESRHRWTGVFLILMSDPEAMGIE